MTLSPGITAFAEALVAYIERDLLDGVGGVINQDTYLFDEGLIDSLKILQLLAFVEHWTGRQIPENEIVMKHFRSPRVIAEHFGA